MHSQLILSAGKDYGELDSFFLEKGIKSFLLVCGPSLRSYKLWDYFDSMQERLGITPVLFSDFTPNPSWESVREGVKIYREKGCGAVAAAGGGSAMDVAKCIKRYAGVARADFTPDYAPDYAPGPNQVSLLAIPTTAGTGSEATRYAVVYYRGEKRSVTDDSCIPEAVLFDPELLRGLPAYHRKASMLDALCHGVESFWSLHATLESVKLSEKAVRSVMENMGPYLANRDRGNEGMLYAANLAGRAINITQTTAAHAMSYRLTSRFGFAHGHSAALCLGPVWRFMLEQESGCVCPGGRKRLDEIMDGIAGTFGCENRMEAPERLERLLEELNMGREAARRRISERITDARGALPIPAPEDAGVRAAFRREIRELAESVNLERLRNSPVWIEPEDLYCLYEEILLPR